MRPFSTPQVEAAFDAFPKTCKTSLLDIRETIFDVAERLEDVGPITETLKWGQPAYLTQAPKTGSTIRLAVTKEDDFGIFTHCQTTLMSDFQSVFSDMRFDGNRGVIFKQNEEVPLAKLEHLIAAALRYHIAD